jgi:hypothetical protein
MHSALSATRHRLVKADSLRKDPFAAADTPARICQRFGSPQDMVMLCVRRSQILGLARFAIHGQERPRFPRGFIHKL